MTKTVSKYQCRWLGHLASMSNEGIPKQLCFGELYKIRPRHGPEKMVERSSSDRHYNTWD